MFVFGRGDNNQLGLGDGLDQHLAPTRLMALDGIPIRKIASGSNQNVAVRRLPYSVVGEPSAYLWTRTGTRHGS